MTAGHQTAAKFPPTLNYVNAGGYHKRTDGKSRVMEKSGPASKPEFAFSRLDFPELPGVEKNERSETTKAPQWGPLRSAPADSPLRRAAEVSARRPAFSSSVSSVVRTCLVRLGPKGSCSLRGSPNTRVLPGSSEMLWRVRRRFRRECSRVHRQPVANVTLLF